MTEEHGKVQVEPQSTVILCGMNRLQQAQHYRNLAEEIRVKAACLKDEEAAQKIFDHLASDYEELAASLEVAAKLLD